MDWRVAAADALVAIHLGYVACVVLGQAAIMVGLALRRAWARNFWLRAVHLLMIAVVVLEAWLRIPCPLTVWEHQLRRAAGQRIEDVSFIGYWARRLIYFQAEAWVFTLMYSIFGLLVLITFILAPPRWPRSPCRTPNHPSERPKPITPSR